MARNTVSIRRNGDQPLAKDQEKQILDDIREALNDCGDTYLASLFSEELVSWAKMKIDQDLPPDIWTERQESLKTVAEIADDLQKARIELNSKAKTLAAALEENKKLKQKVEAFTQDLADFEDAREALANQEALIEELQKEKAGIMKAYGDLAEQDRIFHIKLRDANNMVLLLKARLYDPEHPETAAPADDQDPLRFPYQQSA